MNNFVAGLSAIILGLVTGMAGMLIFSKILGEYGSFLALPIALSVALVTLKHLWVPVTTAESSSDAR